MFDKEKLDKNNKEPENLKSPEESSGEGNIVEVPEGEYKKLLQAVAELKDKNLRLYADFENTKKRLERDKLEFIKYANEVLLYDFLEILDDLERSVKVAQEKHQDYEAFLKGVELVMNRINSLLNKNGVKPIEAQGKMFDPHYHEVLLQEEREDCAEGTVVDELQKGFIFNDRVLRTAKVKLAKKKEEGSQS